MKNVQEKGVVGSDNETIEMWDAKDKMIRDSEKKQEKKESYTSLEWWKHNKCALV